MDIQMHVASFSFISPSTPYKPIQIVFRQPAVEVDESPKKSPKYRKVGKTTKALLVDMVDSGCSIVAVLLFLN